MMRRSPLRKCVTICLSGALVIYSAGCSAFVPYTEPITITAWRPGAQVYVDNRPVGPSPVTVMLPRNGTYSVTAVSDGVSGSAAVGRHVSVTGVLDIVGGCFFLVPFVGCFTPGFWDLDPEYVNVQPTPGVGEWRALPAPPANTLAPAPPPPATVVVPTAPPEASVQVPTAPAPETVTAPTPPTDGIPVRVPPSGNGQPQASGQ